MHAAVCLMEQHSVTAGAYDSWLKPTRSPGGPCVRVVEQVLGAVAPSLLSACQGHDGICKIYRNTLTITSHMSGPKADDAWHSLVEAGPAALPYVVKAFDAARDPDVMISLVHVISEYRSAEAVPFFETLLRDRDAEIWKAALDGLVMVGDKVALEALDGARPNASAEKLEWIDEAVGQIREAQRPTRGCT